VKLEWKKGDGIRLTNDMPAFRTHPKTGEQVWSNHANVFHPAMIHQEYYRFVIVLITLAHPFMRTFKAQRLWLYCNSIARKTGQWRLYLLALVGLLLFTVHSLLQCVRCSIVSHSHMILLMICMTWPTLI
jgi:hypothetical protein